ncbi:MAG: PQQ-binding-like beta-propeller repeat protein, partial [Candidatus Micrarchaeia archaeon]
MRKKNLKKIFAVLMLGILVLLSLAIVLPKAQLQTNTVHANSLQSESSPAQPPVYQLDGNAEHAYALNITINPLDMNVSEAIFATPTIYNNQLFVTTFGLFKYLDSQKYNLTNGSVIDIDINTGQVLWRHNFPDQIMTQPLTIGNTIIIAMGNNLEAPVKWWNYAYSIMALNMTNGSVIWQYNTTNTEIATPAYYNGEVIEPSMGGGGAFVLNATTGKYITTIRTNVPTTLSSPLVVNGTAYFGGGAADFSGGVSSPQNFHFFAVNLTTNQILWEANFTHAGGGVNDVTAAYWNGTVITGYLYESPYANPVIVGLNGSTGKILWEVNETNVLNATSVPNQPNQIFG